MAKAKLLGLVIDKAEVEAYRKPLRGADRRQEHDLEEWKEKFQPKLDPETLRERPGGHVELGFIPQPGPQKAFIDCPADIIVFGGARGGGKTYGSLGDWWLHAEDYGARGRGPDGPQDPRGPQGHHQPTAMTMYGNAATWREHRARSSTSANGARLYMAYLENERTPSTIRAGR